MVRVRPPNSIRGTLLPDWAAAFDTWLDEQATKGEADALIDWEARAPFAASIRFCVTKHYQNSRQ